ncbi:MAG: VWA domain-containing protein [Bacteroidetes bacterium]|nr:VWA domain-containing protein [Bacteroidota bacterium]
MKKTALLLLLASFAIASFAQKQRPVTRILIVFDASNSMYEKYQGTTRIETAKKMFAQFSDSLALIKNAEFALRIYGHQKPVPPQDCSDTKLEIPFQKNNLPNIKERIKNLSPRGTTPIARSLIESAEDFPNSPGVNMIILITDGIEECGGNVCDAAKILREKGIQFRPFVIGIALNASEAKTFDCVGPYYDISTPGIFTEIVDVIITQTLYVTTAQVNLLDLGGKPTETNVNMSFYDRNSNELLYNYVHTMNGLGNPDTVKIDPSRHYKLVVHTIPEVEKDSIILYPGRHNIIAVDAPQGKLQFKMGAFRGTQYQANCIVRKAGSGKTLNVQEVNSTEKYLVGSYDIEVLTLPRYKLNDVQISQASTKTIEIPRPGNLQLNSKEPGYGSIFVEEKGKLTWIYDLNDANPGEFLQLLPGNYKILFRPKKKKETIYTIERQFKIDSDGSITINLY